MYLALVVIQPTEVGPEQSRLMCSSGPCSVVLSGKGRLGRWAMKQGSQGSSMEGSSGRVSMFVMPVTSCWVFIRALIPICPRRSCHLRIARFILASEVLRGKFGLGLLFLDGLGG